MLLDTASVNLANVLLYATIQSMNPSASSNPDGTTNSLSALRPSINIQEHLDRESKKAAFLREYRQTTKTIRRTFMAEGLKSLHQKSATCLQGAQHVKTASEEGFKGFLVDCSKLMEHHKPLLEKEIDQKMRLWNKHYSFESLGSIEALKALDPNVVVGTLNVYYAQQNPYLLASSEQVAKSTEEKETLYSINSLSATNATTPPLISYYQTPPTIKETNNSPSASKAPLAPLQEEPIESNPNPIIISSANTNSYTNSSRGATDASWVQSLKDAWVRFKNSF